MLYPRLNFDLLGKRIDTTNTQHKVVRAYNEKVMTSCHNRSYS